MEFRRSVGLRARARRLIPGGCNTYAKGKGCRVWGIDGNEFIEYGMGMRAVTLGHGFEPVVEDVVGDRGLQKNFGVRQTPQPGFLYERPEKREKSELPNAVPAGDDPAARPGSVIRGQLGPRDHDIDETAQAVHDALTVYRKALENGVEGHLEGRSVKPVFRQFNE